MADNKAFKDYYDQEMAERLARDLTAVYPPFPAADFINHVTPRLPPLELKARVAVFTGALRDHLPNDYTQSIGILLALLGPELTLEQGMFSDSWFLMPIAHFVELYGLKEADFETSMRAMYEITKRHSSEFAIRPYLQKYPERTLAVLDNWTNDPSPHVRRLVSEGSRPRLPWASQLKQFIHDPTPTLALLEKLKDDPAEYVRRSVANHLNDIAKDHPQRVIETCARWMQEDASPERAWIVRHALRTLVKAGNPNALAVLGYEPPQVALRGLSVTPAVLTLGESLTIRFTLHNQASTPQNLLVDYRLHFMKANGEVKPKVFKLTTRQLDPGEMVTIERQHPIRPITTRKYYPGRQLVDVQVNGQVVGNTAVFDLIIPPA